MAKEKNSKRKQVVSLVSMICMALVAFLIYGLAVNWNLFIVLACFAPIMLIGLVIIFLPSWLNEKHEEICKKVDKGLADVGKTLSK